MAAPQVQIIKHWSDGSGTIGYAEGKLRGREFTASWATWCPLGAIFYDSWLDATDRQLKAMASALREAGASPVPSL